MIQILCLVFKSPRSYTAEDVVELHCHGGVVSVQRILSACVQAGARTARPGEFTLRAFLNGRIDLTQVQNKTTLSKTLFGTGGKRESVDRSSNHRSCGFGSGRIERWHRRRHLPSQIFIARSSCGIGSKNCDLFF